MIYSSRTRHAMKLAYEFHHDQHDKAGVPYIFHCIHVAEQMNTEDETVVALLHDVLEDCEVSKEELANVHGIPSHIIDALVSLNHLPGEKYSDYIKRVSENEIATAVKIADLNHNSDLSRLEKVTEKDLQRRRKYLCAIKYLQESSK